MGRLRRFRYSMTSPQQAISPSPIRTLSEVPALTSSNQPQPLNDGIGLVLFLQQQIVPRLVKPMVLQAPLDLVQNEFRLQIQATQQISQELGDAHEEEYEHAEAIREAQEVIFREEQEQQASFFQFRRFHKWEDDQAVAGRLFNESSRNTWEDIPSQPTLIIPDSGATSHMQLSTDATKNETLLFKSNCPVCHLPSTVDGGHTIKSCPVVMQLGLRFPETSHQLVSWQSPGLLSSISSPVAPFPTMTSV